MVAHPPPFPGPGADVPLPVGPNGLLTLLAQALAAEASVRLVVPTRAGPGEIHLVGGAVRAVRYGNRGGLSALVALDLLAEGPVQCAVPEPAADQFGLLPSVVLEQARRTSDQVLGLSPAPAPALAEDTAIGAPIPADDTSTDDLLSRARVTMTVRGDRPDESPDVEDFPLGFLDDLAAEAAPAATALAAAAPDQTAWTPPALGQMLGKCYLSAELGRGASAIVYRALQMSLKVDVAVKVFVPENDQRSHLSIREARVLARLNHPNILRVLDCSEDPPWPHLVMEYIDGPTLADLIAQAGRLPVSTAVPLILQAARGLAHAHGEGVTHCDVKPGNLLINRRHQVKVADLGVARLALGDEADLAIEGRAVVGTPAYIAPELVRDGIGAAGAPSDLYSLGATLYHALAGEPPFLHEDPVELMVLQVRARPRPLRSLVPDLPRSIETLVDGLLAKDPAERPDYETVIDVLSTLDQRLSHRLAAQQRSPIYATIRATLRGAVDRLLNRSTRRLSRRTGD